MTKYEQRRIKSNKCIVCNQEISDEEQHCIIKIPYGRSINYKSCHKTCINELLKLLKLIREGVENDTKKTIF